MLVEALNSLKSTLESLKNLLPQDAGTQAALGNFIYVTAIAADPTGLFQL